MKNIEAAASAAVKMNHSGLSAGFLTNGNIYGERNRYIPASGNQNQLMLILETLSALIPGDGLSMKDLLLNSRYLKNGSVVFILHLILQDCLRLFYI